MTKSYVFTSESVSEGHPDKVADQISDAVLDAYLELDPLAKVACETLVTRGALILAGEVNSTEKLDEDVLRGTVRNTIRNIGYVDEATGFNCDRFEFENRLHRQSRDIERAVEQGGNNLGAGDQGMMFGYAVNETPELMPLPIWLAHRLVEKQAEVRKNGTVPWFGPDAKSQVVVRYRYGRPAVVEKVVLSTQHSADAGNGDVKESVTQQIIEAVIPSELKADNIEYLVNPSGRFVTGGPEADTGVTGRKIIVDTYGGSCPHGGGAFSGKDATKVDRSAAYMARYVAKNLVAAGLASRCTVQLSYAIGRADPTSVFLDFYGTGRVDEDKVLEFVKGMVDLTPAGIIKTLDLRRPIYSPTAAYGHFGRNLPTFTWEKTDLVGDLRNRFGM